MIGQRQKFLMHHYPRVAGLSQATYHRVLLSCAGVRSAADRAMSQDGFERCMAAFETMLAERVAQGHGIIESAQHVDAAEPVVGDRQGLGPQTSGDHQG